MKTVVIIGGGITGLSTAYYLRRTLNQYSGQTEPANIILVEAEQTLGGKMRTVYDGGFSMESGADSIVTRKTNVAPLVQELNLEDQVVYNATGISYIYTDGRLKQIPKDAVFGIPTSVESLATTELVSAEGKVRALKDLYTPNEHFTKNDSVGAFLEAFLGKEFVEKQIAPVLSGVYSGKLSDLTIASTLPYLIDYKNEYGSLIKGLSENRAKFQSGGEKKFMSFQNGVSALIDALEQHLTGTDIVKGVRAESVAKDGSGYRVTLADGRVIDADFVVLGTMHNAAQRLLADPVLDQEFDQLKNSSMISVYVGFDLPDAELPADGTGFITADGSDITCNACTWTSRKWEHTSRERKLLVRLFYKSSNPRYDELVQLSEGELLHVALEDIRKSLGITGEPVTHEVTKWHNVMPNYHIKHHSIVKELEQKMTERFPDIYLAGCSYYGVGIPDCIANGEQTAYKIASKL